MVRHFKDGNRISMTMANWHPGKPNISQSSDSPSLFIIKNKVCAEGCALALMLFRVTEQVLVGLVSPLHYQDGAAITANLRKENLRLLGVISIWPVNTSVR